MPAASSAEPVTTPSDPPPDDRPVFDVPVAQRLSMVVLGFIPILHAGSVLAALALPLTGVIPGAFLWSPPVLLYLAPPIVCRLVGLWIPVPDGTFETSSREFLHWWFHAQWQVVFNRFPALEEILRMVPGLYSQWLRLWGSEVGTLVYWSSGVTLLDRSCLNVGDRVIFGAGVVLSPHNLSPDAARRIKLLIAPIRIGSDTMIGGAAVLTPGFQVAAEELVPAFYRAMPFSRWRDGRRRRDGGADWATAAALMSARSEPPADPES
ncbi:MAG: hypothetical protein MPN21_15185 [Thermoanaerobaculia bacterium]|nr:hypothetical protein [Thermoanaerobaculia bacterium]